MPKVFVYGTLLSGESNNHRFLQTSVKKGNYALKGFTMYDLGSFPACIQSLHYGDVVVGEVWEVTNEVFQSLDYLEGYPRFYDRIEVDTFDGTAWIYIHNEKPDGERISSGSWKEHLKEKYGN